MNGLYDILYDFMDIPLYGDKHELVDILVNIRGGYFLAEDPRRSALTDGPGHVS